MERLGAAQRPEEIQREYYRRTAARYDEQHVRDDDEHGRALRFISTQLASSSIDSLLDVGSGSGRALRFFLGRHPQLRLRGIEPVEALIGEAERAGVPHGLIDRGRGEALPYRDGSYDAVCGFGILHHVKQPNAVVREMTRVAKRAVFISDSNRFGQGSLGARRVKLLLWRMRLWKVANFVKTRGKGYVMTEGDGLAYSYSVFDSLDTLTAWADRVLLVPTVPCRATSWSHPLLTAGHVLVCALRDGDRRPVPPEVGDGTFTSLPPSPS